MRNIFILILTISLIPSLSQAQKWKRYRTEYSFSIGASNFLGDLGGADQTGTNGLKDLELAMTRYALGIGYKYQVIENFYVKTNLIYARVSGDDALTNDYARNLRNISFRAHLIELSTQVEYVVIKPKTGHRYKLRGVRGKSWFKFQIYLFGGIGGLWYNPQGQRNGSWTNLQPLGTEGQGLDGTKKKYSRFTAVIPYGIGIRRNLGSGAASQVSPWAISLELSMRQTFSDYIDDVSDVYFDNDQIRASYGDDAAYFADPPAVFTGTPNQQRGDPSDNDTYMLGVMSISYRVSTKRRNLPKF